MNQELALAILDARHSVFLTGPAGSGKTHVLNTFVKDARKDGKSVAVTASTGLAATHLGGATIHSWAGIGIADELHPRHITDMSKTRMDQIGNTDILIIDEVSMLHDFRLDMVDEVCRAVRGEDAPFGGLQVVLSGDFYQLPPVNRSDSREGGFVIDSQAWSDMDPVVCYLSDQYRQDGDDQLLEILTAMRDNDIRRRHAVALLEKKTVRTPFDAPVTELYTRNIDVDKVNQDKLNAMPGEVHEYEMTSTGRKGAIESLKKSCLAPEILQLKKGAFVMFVKNSPEKKYVNGTLGEVVAFDDEGFPVVQTKDGKEIEVRPDMWEMRDGEKKVAGLTQLPLRLAWAITVHKSQGMTLDAAHIDLSTAFVPGMGYVALSRVRNLDNLTLGGLNRMALMIHEKAYDIDADLRSKSKSHAKQHADLIDDYRIKQKERAKKPKKSKTDWNEKVAKMRETHPNAFRPWKDEDDQVLKSMWEKDQDLKAIEKKLGRHPGSIRARVKKHFGDDIFQK